jgi:hypothetical protein
MAQRTNSPLWWSRLRTLQLHVLGVGEPGTIGGAHGYRSQTERIRHDRGARAFRIWNEGVVAAPDDPYSRLRLLDYYTRAVYVTLVTEGRRPSFLEQERIKRAAEELSVLTPLSSDPRMLRHYKLNVVWRIQRVVDHDPNVAVRA